MNEGIKLSPEERRKRLKEIQLPAERKIIKHPDFEIAKPEKVSTIGFLVVLGISLFIIFLTWLLGKILS